jgi:hypothetical protein
MFDAVVAQTSLMITFTGDYLQMVATVTVKRGYVNNGRTRG